MDILPVFSLVLVFNEGAAFGFLNDAGGWQHYLFVGLASVFSLILVVWIWRERERNVWLADRSCPGPGRVRRAIWWIAW